MKQPTRRLVAAALTAAALASPPGIAAAQDATPARSVITDPVTARDVADLLHRRGTVWLRTLASPTPSDYRSVALTMSIARRLVPDDAQLLRHEIAAWDAAGDAARVLALTRELVRLDPQDTVASLRVISAGIARLQDADRRLAAYDRLLGPDGAGLDPSVRSRLALDAAMLARETGDDRGFTERLLKATTLDVTNKEAVSLQAAYYLDRTSDASERFDLLSDVVMSDPLDAFAARNLADELIRHGAFRGALRFLDLARSIDRARGRSDTVEEIEMYLAVAWNAEGLSPAQDLIERLRNQAMVDENMRRRQIEMQGLDPGEPQPVVVHPRLELIGMMMLNSAGNPEKARIGYERVMLGYTRTVELINDPEFWPQGATQESMDASLRETEHGRLWARLLANVDIETAEQDLLLFESAEGVERPDDLTLTRWRGWLQLRRGDGASARATLSRIADIDAAARYGLAVLAENEGNQDAALKDYARTALFFPESIYGAVSRARITQLRGRPLQATDAATNLESKCRAFAPWLEAMVADPWTFMSIQAEHLRTSLEPLERPELRVTIRNLSRMPLAMGPSASIDSTIMLSPRLLVNGREQMEIMRPEILRLNQRFRLMPGETFVATIWTNYGWIGTLCDMAVGADVMLRWRLVQGFVVQQNGSYAPGPLCLAVQSDMIRRANLDGRLESTQLAEQIAVAEGKSLTQALALAATRLVPGWKEETRDTIDTARAQELIATAVGKRMATMDDWERVRTLTRLADADFFSHPDDILVELVTLPAQEVRSVWAMAAYLNSAARTSDDPVLARAMQDPDPELSELASIIHTRLRAGEPDDGFGDEEPLIDGPTSDTP